MQTAKNTLLAYFFNHTVCKFPANESEDGIFISSKGNLSSLANLQNMTVSELCLLTTQMFSRKNNSTIEPAPPILSNENNIFENAFKIRNMVQYCNNILRYTLKSRNIDIDDLNQLNELISCLENIELLDSRDRVFTLSKDTYYTNEEIVIQQKNVLGAYRNYPVQYYNDEYYNTDYTIESVNPLSSPKTLRFSKSLGKNTDTIFDKSIGYHKKVIKDYFNRKHYLSYKIIPTQDIVKKVEITEDGDLLVYFIPTNTIDNTIIATDFNVDNNGDIVETDINIVDNSYLEDKGIEDIWIDENDDLCFKKYTIPIESIILTGNKSILSYRDSDSVILTATALDFEDNPLSNVPISFKKNNIVIDTINTDNNGEAELIVNSTGVGDISFIASVGEINSNIYNIEDCLVYDVPLSDNTNLITVSNPQNVPYSLTYSQNSYDFDITSDEYNDKFIKFIFYSGQIDNGILFEFDFKINYSAKFSPKYEWDGYNALFTIMDNETNTGLYLGTWSIQRALRIYSNNTQIYEQLPSNNFPYNRWIHIKMILKHDYVLMEMTHENDLISYNVSYENDSVNLSYNTLECTSNIMSGSEVGQLFKNIKIKKI